MILSRGKLKVGIIGCGAIGSEVAYFIDRKLNKFFTLIGIYDINKDKVESVIAHLNKKPRIFSFHALIASSDIIIECASIECAKKLIEKTRRDKILFILSSGVFSIYPRVLKKIFSFKRIFIPSGAICGIDGIESFALSKIKSLKLITSKPPFSLEGIKFLERKDIDIRKIKKEKILFRGNIEKAIKYFPKNINVASTLFLATGFKNIEVTIKIDPHIKRNTHRIELIADKGKLSITLENVPSRVNPKTSVVTILSVKNLLKKLVNTLWVGS